MSCDKMPWFCYINTNPFYLFWEWSSLWLEWHVTQQHVFLPTAWDAAERENEDGVHGTEEKVSWQWSRTKRKCLQVGHLCWHCHEWSVFKMTEYGQYIHWSDNITLLPAHALWIDKVCLVEPWVINQQKNCDNKKQISLRWSSHGKCTYLGAMHCETLLCWQITTTRHNTVLTLP